MNRTTETCGRYEIEISGPDSETNNCFWVVIRSTKAKMGRTCNNITRICKTIEDARIRVDAFKASKSI